MTARSRLGLFILAGFVVFSALTAVAFGWYGYRVFTELGRDSWKTPTTILAHDGSTFLEVYGADWRATEPVVLADLPEHVPAAFMAAEDIRFRSHPGIDPIGITRALLTNVRSGGIAQGGSTITQQLAKTRFLSNERTFTRKGIEAMLALLIELRLSKDDILEAYLNDVYLGHRGGRTVLGLDEAARVYFDKAPSDITPAEAALLAGMIRAPNRDNPEERPEVAKERRDAVLEVMRDREWIDEDEYDDAIGSRVRFREGSIPAMPHPFLMAAIRHEAAERVGERRLRGGGLKIHTAISEEAQEAAEAAVSRGTRSLRSRYSWLRRDEPLQAAILSVDPATGGVRALVGGVSYRQSQFDRTRRMQRQPGSALKPFVYAAAIAERRITPASILEDAPIEIELSRNDVWKPRNYDDRFRGQVTAREAFEKSLNTTAVRVAGEVGVGNVRAVLQDAGVEGELSSTPAIALGVDIVSMRDMVSAYSIFPNLGMRTEPHLIERVESGGGRTIWRWKGRPRKVLEPEVAYVVHSLMRGVVQRGTASRLGGSGLGHVAGKTGTTSDYRDAWFVGYSPDLLTAAWVGFDDGTPLRISSAEAALPVWASYMGQVRHERGEIAPPEGVSLVAIEPASGLLWASGCGHRFEEAFIAGTEPEQRCRGRVARPSLLAEFEEPAVISMEELSRWLEEFPGAPPEEIVIDPGPVMPGDDPDVLDEQEQADIDRQVEDALREARENPPPPPSEDRGEELRREIERQRDEAARELEKRRDEALKELEKRARDAEKDQRREEREERKEERREDKPPSSPLP